MAGFPGRSVVFGEPGPPRSQLLRSFAQGARGPETEGRMSFSARQVSRGFYSGSVKLTFTVLSKRAGIPLIMAGA